MMLEPVDVGSKRFNPDMIRRYDVLPDSVENVLLVDPANEKKKRSDYTAMTVVGVSRLNKFIVDIVRDKLGPDERINAAIQLIKDHNIKEVAWEKVGLCNDIHYLSKRLTAEGLHNVTVHEVTAQNTSKEDRIRDILVPQYIEGEWLWPHPGVLSYYSKYDQRTIDPIIDLKLEFLQFPHGKHDDMLDTMTFLTALNVDGPLPEEEKEPEELTFGQYVAMTEGKQLADRANPYKRLEFPSRV